MKQKIHFQSLEFMPETLANQGYWVSDETVTAKLSNELLLFAENIYQKGRFSPAKIGKGVLKQRNEDIRRDYIYWVDNWSSSPLEDIEDLYTCLSEISRRELFLPIKRFESAFSYYPPGAYYERHVDRHINNPSRCLTCVLYLSDCKSDEGGQLVIFDKNKKVIQNIEPKKNRLVIFDSKLAHEVTVTKKIRWSLTTWLRDDISPKIVI